MRRRRDLLRWAATVAPYAGVALVVVSAVGRLFAWPLALTLGALVAAVAILTTVAIVRGRRRESDDALAQRVDRDASLGGELRSAHWFAAAETADPWAEFHLTRAAARVTTVDWPSLYPREPHTRAWVVAAASLTLALAIPLTVKSRALPPPAATSAEAPPAGAAAAEIGDELRAKLDAMLAAMTDEKALDAGQIADLEMLKKLMASVDPALQKKLDDLLKKKPLDDKAGKAKGLDDPLAERGDPADSAAGLPEDVRWALEDLAARLANSDANRQTNEKNPSASSETGEKGRGSDQAQTSEANEAQAGAQMMRQAAADPGAAKMMPGGGGMMGGDSRAGAGGNNPNKPGDLTAMPEQIAQALRKELIEANTDNLGENVPKEDLRRKTEQGKSVIGFTRVTTPAASDPSRATAPPPVPEARQPLLQRYFIRK